MQNRYQLAQDRAVLAFASAFIRRDLEGCLEARAAFRRAKRERVVESNPSFDGEQAADRDLDFTEQLTA
jgi:hypothetical protein